MTDWNEEQTDDLLRDYLTAALDGQQGRAEEFFRRHVLSGRPQPAPKRAWRAGGMRLWFCGVVGGAVAASLATLWAGPALLNASHESGDDSRSHVQLPSQPSLRPTQVERFVSSQTSLVGTFLIDDETPVKVI